MQVINALLGGSFLAEGILPTTNEISVLKFRHAAHCTECKRCQWHASCHLASHHQRTLSSVKWRRKAHGAAARTALHMTRTMHACAAPAVAQNLEP